MPKKTVKPTLPVRPPIVTIMGHVDHGKTSLLDHIRKTRVAASEHGGITQHIGAYQAEYKDKKITFIDTPGHAAFQKMRARGANITDIIVLVVSAVDGVQPQTVESIKHIKTANVPYIVAINKIDLPGAVPDKIKSELTEHEVFVEGYGGQIPAVNLSAKTGEGVDQLLDMILLVAELEELTADPKAPLEAVIIESNLDKHQGPLATVIVKNGTLVPGQTIYLYDTSVKIRSLLNEFHKPLTIAVPSTPALVLGFGSVPAVGMVLKDHPEAIPEVIPIPAPAAPATPAPEGEETKEIEVEEKKPSFNLILKADTAGTLEAIMQSILHDEITLINKGVGPITEADVLLALDTKAVIIGFNIPVTTAAQKLAGYEHVKIKTFAIIYELIEYLEDKILELLEPTIHEEPMGTAHITQVFDIRGIKIAGCQVQSGRLQKNDRVHLLRREKMLFDSKIASLKQGKTDAKRISSGEDCGVVLDPPFDFRAGDVIKSYRIIEK